jgi:hypothetical protein
MADYFKGAEKYLYNYRSIKANIEIMKIRITEIENTPPDGMKGIDYGTEKTSETFAFRSATEGEAVARMSEIERLQRKIQAAEYTAMKIEKAVGALPVLERRIVRLRYFSDERLTWKQIADIVRYDPDYCRKQVRSRAIQKIAVAIFGTEALNIPVLYPPQRKENAV